MNSKYQRLGADGHGRRKLPSLATNLAIASTGVDLAAPYNRHIASAAPYLSASPLETVPGLMLPSINSPKPHAARKAPTRVNLFKAQKTLSLSGDCGSCGVSNGTIVVMHFGMVPPQIYLCYTIKQGGKEMLIPYEHIKYQVDPSTQFTYAMNAAASISLAITSFAAASPLNGQATAAHVMDLDDIDIYSSGSFELRSTTPADAISSTSMTKGIIGIMGPESWSETLLHPYHCGSKTYPGWSYSVKTNRFNPEKNAIVYLDEITEHRWFVDTTVEVMVVGHFPDGTDQGGTLSVHLGVIRGKCPPSLSCSPSTLQEWGELHNDWKLLAMGTAPECAPKAITDEVDNLTKKPVVKDLKEVIKKQKKETLTRKRELKCGDNEGKAICEVGDDPPPCEGVSGVASLCCSDSGSDTARAKLKEGGYTTLTASGEYTTCALENAVAVMVGWDACKTGGPEPTCVEIHIRTRCHNPEAQFGPAFVARLSGLTKDIVIQLNARAAVAGIMTGSARAIAPPSMPSNLALGEEDAVLTQALFDSGSGPRRVFTGEYLASLDESTLTTTRSDAANLLEAAPIGDTIRSIGQTISRVGHSLGGPFGTLGDIVGTVGGIAGGIGDALGSLFSAPEPKRPRLLAAPLYAAPDGVPVGFLNTATVNPVPLPRSPSEGAVYATVEEVEKEAKKANSWSMALDRSLTATGAYYGNTKAEFPFVFEDYSAGGIATVFVTLEPFLEMGGRTVRYTEVVFDPNTAYYFDEYLIAGNKPEYIMEAVLALLVTEHATCFVSTDSPAKLFGDSFAAAILAAQICPSPNAAFTGGLQIVDGQVILRPVGAIAGKIQAVIDEGITLIAPCEKAITTLRDGSSDTPIVNTTDIIRGVLRSTPQVVCANTITEMIVAAAFVGRTHSLPFSQEERAEKEAMIAKSTEAAKIIEDERAPFMPKPGETESERAARISHLFDVDLPNDEKMSVPLLDPKWWNTERQAIIFTPAKDKGLGISQAKFERILKDGLVNKLRGIALGVLSRELAERRRMDGHRRRPKTKPGSRVAPYKRPRKTQIASIIEQLRGNQATQPAAKRPADDMEPEDF